MAPLRAGPVEIRRRHAEGRRRHATTAAAAATGIVQATATAAGAAVLVLAAEAAYVGIRTPRLPPPDRSGHDFDADGILVQYHSSSATSKEGNANITTANRSDDENDARSETIISNCDNDDAFNLVLLGDSPVEGIGNYSHNSALGGQTASAFAKAQKRSVRYWAYGRSGLTARGIESEMIAKLKDVSNKLQVDGQVVDAVVLSCGVNNVLWGHSATRFGTEVTSLLDAVDDCFAVTNNSRNSSTVLPHSDRPMIILMGLLDFSHMPFLPWPLSSVLGWRSRSLQSKMEEVVKHRRGAYNDGCNHRVGCSSMVAQLPLVSSVLDGLRHDLLDHLDNDDLKSIWMEDFFADDGFHPANHGTAMLGNLLAQTYAESKKAR